MINEEWNKTQNDAPFVAFYDMRAVTFVMADEMADVSIGGLQWFILILLQIQVEIHILYCRAQQYIVVDQSKQDNKDTENVKSQGL